ncbi:MAG: FKBP-type peptidyl-prolyl cis-trans isomerase, partial [Bacteroidales bacterium]|nr:FKBP-type peptidyl-prolyl cis-trans isomerase [Bacteroidales bacterium]
MHKIIFTLLLFLTVTISCRQPKTIDGIVLNATSTNDKEPEQPFVESNKKIIALENENIDLFIKRYGWHPTITSSGLRIEIVKEGTGSNFKSGDEVTLLYTMTLLSGEKIYSSEEDAPINFKVDKTDALLGLHEAAKYMKHGTQAHLVIPSYLAYGVAGDG